MADEDALISCYIGALPAPDPNQCLAPSFELIEPTEGLIMTYYSDLIEVISTIENIQHGTPLKRSVSDLRILCGTMLKINPDEDLAKELLRTLWDITPETSRDTRHLH